MIVDKLERIHKNIYDRFEYISDSDKHNLDEYWEIPDISEGLNITGDCEEFALACRELCLQQGIKSKIVICEIKRTGEYHAVLNVGKYILDNRFNKIKTIGELDRLYDWIASSGYSLKDEWFLIEGLE